jgi:hypothetical protein
LEVEWELFRVEELKLEQAGDEDYKLELVGGEELEWELVKS